MVVMYAGVDGCRQGWVALVLPGENLVEGFTRFGDLVEHLEAMGVEVVGVDMPIGPPMRGERACDLAARAFLGPRRSSLFMTPTAAALAAPTQAQATVINRERGGKGVSAQAFALRSKIQEVAQADATATVIEVHPELTFRVLGAPQFSKKSWAGVRERLAILESEGLHPLDWASVGWATTDDTLDAAAAALSARRFAQGRARAFPETEDPARIWA
jgi:predicted RNase H-like nuclease